MKESMRKWEDQKEWRKETHLRICIFFCLSNFHYHHHHHHLILFLSRTLFLSLSLSLSFSLSTILCSFCSAGRFFCREKILHKTEIEAPLFVLVKRFLSPPFPSSLSLSLAVYDWPNEKVAYSLMTSHFKGKRRMIVSAYRILRVPCLTAWSQRESPNRCEKHEKGKNDKQKARISGKRLRFFACLWLFKNIQAPAYST